MVDDRQTTVAVGDVQHARVNVQPEDVHLGRYLVGRERHLRGEVVHPAVVTARVDPEVVRHQALHPVRQGVVSQHLTVVAQVVDAAVLVAHPAAVLVDMDAERRGARTEPPQHRGRRPRRGRGGRHLTTRHGPGRALPWTAGAYPCAPSPLSSSPPPRSPSRPSETRRSDAARPHRSVRTARRRWSPRRSPRRTCGHRRSPGTAPDTSCSPTVVPAQRTQHTPPQRPGRPLRPSSSASKLVVTTDNDGPGRDPCGRRRLRPTGSPRAIARRTGRPAEIGPLPVFRPWGRSVLAV